MESSHEIARLCDLPTDRHTDRQVQSNLFQKGNKNDTLYGVSDYGNRHQQMGSLKPLKGPQKLELVINRQKA
jgi:hypothetical protein